MNDNILESIKLLGGLTEEYTHFNQHYVMYINSVFFTLMQLGVGPVKGFIVKDGSETWSDFMPDDPDTDMLREATKTYISAKVKLEFDPPLSSSAMEALTRIVNEYEWRLNLEAETPVH